MRIKIICIWILSIIAILCINHYYPIALGPKVEDEFIESIDTEIITEYFSNTEVLDEWTIEYENGIPCVLFLDYFDEGSVDGTVKILPQSSSVDKARIVKKVFIGHRRYPVSITIYKDNIIIEAFEQADIPNSRFTQECLTEMFNKVYEAYEQLK